MLTGKKTRFRRQEPSCDPSDPRRALRDQRRRQGALRTGAPGKSQSRRQFPEGPAPILQGRDPRPCRPVGPHPWLHGRANDDPMTNLPEFRQRKPARLGDPQPRGAFGRRDRKPGAECDESEGSDLESSVSHKSIYTSAGGPSFFYLMMAAVASSVRPGLCILRQAQRFAISDATI
jgi:hypothetical protein